MVEKEFNLLCEPWILAMKPDGVIEEVSLLELFRRASAFTGLAGELPTQDVAVLRLLLAILHSVFGRYDLDGKPAPLTSPYDALDRWKALWDMGSFPMKAIEEYLRRWKERFWLFHPERPFYQVAALRDRDDIFGPFDVSKLNGELAESDHKVRLFPQRTGDGKKVLCYAEAVRWLLYVNAFAETFGKLEAKGKQNKNSGSLGVGWLGKLGLIFAVGNNLFETLLLNLVMLKDGENQLWGIEKPIWEMETVKSDERHEIIVPDNPSELYTLQSRRLLLKNENGYVTGYYFLSGDFFSKVNAFSEQMTVWYNTSKKEASLPDYQPRRHDPTRQLWRDFSALVAQGANGRCPGVVRWLSRLKSDRLIASSRFHFQTAGVSYGTMEAVIEDTFSDSISFNADLLTNLGEDWVSRIIDELDTTEQLVDMVGYLAQSLAKSMGDTDDKSLRGVQNSAKEQAYFRLDLSFRQWLESINPKEDDIDETCDKWWEQAQRTVRAVGRELVEQSGTRAFIGRDLEEKVKGKDMINRYTAPKAYNWFLLRTSTRQALKGGEKND